jgi:hypothetical protein
MASHTSSGYRLGLTYSPLSPDTRARPTGQRNSLIDFQYRDLNKRGMGRLHRGCGQSSSSSKSARRSGSNMTVTATT